MIAAVLIHPASGAWTVLGVAAGAVLVGGLVAVFFGRRLRDAVDRFAERTTP